MSHFREFAHFSSNRCSTYHKRESCWLPGDPNRLDLPELLEHLFNILLGSIVIQTSDIHLTAFHIAIVKLFFDELMDYDFDIIERLIDIECNPKPVPSDAFGRAIRESDRRLHDRESRRSRSRSRRRSRSRSRNRSSHRDANSRRSSIDRDSERLADESRRNRLEEDRKKHHDQSRREDCSVMVMGLHPSCGDRDVYEFFTKEAGKVRDLYVVRDTRTGKSKGVAYVEFYLQESIIKALACNGRMVSGHGPIRVQASGAEKNRAANAQKQATVSMQDKPIVLYVMGLSGMLKAINEPELTSLFSPFGQVDNVEIGMCPYTHTGRGFAKVLFRKAAEARDAMAALNGYQLAGQTLQVGYLSGSLGESARRVMSTDDDLL